MSAECDLTINFALGGNSLAFLGGGWARGEPDFTWTIGPESHLVLPRLLPADEYVVTIDVVPFTHAPALPAQRLIVSVNDRAVGSTELSRPTLLGYRIPAHLVAGSERMLITLQHPDAARPADLMDGQDRRLLGFALRAAKLFRINDPDQGNALAAGFMLAGDKRTFGVPGHSMTTEWAVSRSGLAISDLALQFESLGENCEFGLFQRRCDAEPLGLLRFSSTFMRNLIRGIETGFEGLGDASDVDPRLEGDGVQKEYMIHERRFGLVYHSFVYEGQRSVWLMKEQEVARLTFLRRKFIEELAANEKIFVYKHGCGVSEEEILPLHMALSRRNKATLLWVVPAERNRPCGTVEVLMPGLLKGYIDRFAPDQNAHDLSFDGWLRVCANAYALNRRLQPAALVHTPADRFREVELATGSC